MNRADRNNAVLKGSGALLAPIYAAVIAELKTMFPDASVSMCGDGVRVMISGMSKAKMWKEIWTMARTAEQYLPSNLAVLKPHRVWKDYGASGMDARDTFRVTFRE